MFRFLQMITGGLFGGGRNVITEVTETFIPNAERTAQRQATYDTAALAQLAAEFQHQRRGLFDRFVDGLNRLPRPAMALGIIFTIVWTFVDPEYMAIVYQTMSIIPEYVLGLFGIIITFYFGGRAQAKELGALSRALPPGAADTARSVNEQMQDLHESREPPAEFSSTREEPMVLDNPVHDELHVNAADTGTDAQTSLKAVQTSSARTGPASRDAITDALDVFNRG